MAGSPAQPVEQLKLSGSSGLSLPEDSYVYSIVPTSAQVSNNSYAPLASSGSHLAVLSSDNSIRIVDPTSLQLVQALQNVNQSVTCLKRMAPPAEECRVLITSGRDGLVRCWDTRTNSKTMEFKAGWLRCRLLVQTHLTGYQSKKNRYRRLHVAFKAMLLLQALSQSVKDREMHRSTYGMLNTKTGPFVLRA